MTTFKYQAGAPTIIGYKPSDDFTFSIAETPVVSGGTWSYGVAYKDSIVDSLSSYTADNSFRIDVTPAAEFPNYSLSIRSGGGYATLNGNTVSRIADGQVIIDITSRYGTKSFSRVMGQQVTSGFKNWIQYAQNSLGKHVYDQINTWLSGKQPGINTQDIMMVGYSPNPDSPSGTRNTSIFTTTNFDLSAISFASGGTGRNSSIYPGTLVSKRHVLMAWHTHVEAPVTKFCWMKPNGAFVTANVVSSAKVGSDLGIFYLDTDVEALGLTPMAVSSEGLKDRLSTLSERPYGLPAIIRDLNKGDKNVPPTNVLDLSPHLRIVELNSTQSMSVPSGYSPTFSTWMSLPSGGDSSSPVMIPVGGEPVLLFLLYYPTYGDDLSTMNDVITLKMRELAAAQGDSYMYTLRNPSLTAFSVF